MLISFLAISLILVINDKAIAEKQDSSNYSTSSEVVDKNYSNTYKNFSNNSTLSLQLLRNTGLYNDTDKRSPQKIQIGNVTYIDPSAGSNNKGKSRRFKRKTTNVHRGSRQIGRSNYRRAQNSTKGPRDKRKVYHDRGRTVSPSNLKNRKLYPRYATDYGNVRRKNARHIDNKRARRLIENRRDFLDDYFRRQMYQKNEDEESKNIEDARNNNIVSAKSNAKGKKYLRKKQYRTDNISGKASYQKKAKANIRKLPNNLKPQFLKVNNAEKQSLRNQRREQKKKIHNVIKANSKDAQNGNHKSADVNVQKGLNKKRKEKKEEIKKLKGDVSKTTNISNVKIQAVQSKSEKDESVIRLKENSTKINEIKAGKKKETLKGSKDTKNRQKTPKKKGKSYNTRASKSKSYKIENYANVIVARRSRIPIKRKRKEDDQMKSAINKTNNISNVNKIAMKSKSEKHEDPIKLNENSTKTPKTRKDKKGGTLKDKENTDKTLKQKKKGANESKTDKNESHATASMNLRKNSNIPTKRKEDEDQLSKINKTAIGNKSERNNGVIKPKKSDVKPNETREVKKQKILKDMKNIRNSNKTPKQKKKSDNQEENSSNETQQTKMNTNTENAKKTNEMSKRKEKSHNTGASKGKSNSNESLASTIVNEGKNSSISIKRKENEQINDAIKKTIDISKVNRTAMENKSETDKGVRKFKQNNTEINETRKGKRKETPKNNKNAKNMNKTVKQKNKVYDTGASKRKISKVGRNPSKSIKRKEDKQLSGAVNKTIQETKESKREKSLIGNKNTPNLNKTPKKKEGSFSTSASKRKDSKNESHISANVNTRKDSGISIKRKESERLKSNVNNTIHISTVNKTPVQSKSKKGGDGKQNYAKINDTRQGKKSESLKHRKDTKGMKKLSKQKKEGDNTKAAKSKDVEKENYVVVRANVKDNFGKPTKLKKYHKSRSKTAAQSRRKEDNGKINKARSGKKNEILKGTRTKKDKRNKNNARNKKKISYNVRSGQNKDVHLSITANVKKNFSKIRKRKEQEEHKSRNEQVSKGNRLKIQNKKENNKSAIMRKQSKSNVVKGPRNEEFIKPEIKTKAVKSMIPSNKVSKIRLNVAKSNYVAKKINATLDNGNAKMLDSINKLHSGIVNKTRSGNVNNRTRFKSTTNINSTFDLHVPRNDTQERNLFQKIKSPLSKSSQFLKSHGQQFKRIQTETPNSSDNNNQYLPGIRRGNDKIQLNYDIKHKSPFQNYNSSHKNYSLPYKPTSSNEVLDDTDFRFPARPKPRREKYFGNEKRYRNEFGEKHNKPIIKVSNYDRNVNDSPKGKDHKSPNKNGTITISRRIHNVSVSHSATKDIQNVSAWNRTSKFNNQLLQREPLGKLQNQNPTVIKFENVTEYNTTDISQTHSLNNGKLQGFNEKIVKTVHKSYILTEVSSTDEILSDDLQSLLDTELLE